MWSDPFSEEYKQIYLFDAVEKSEVYLIILPKENGRKIKIPGK